MTDYREQREELRKTSQQILRGQGDHSPEELLGLAKQLKILNEFGYARKLLSRAREQRITDRATAVELGQQHALCTYKDPDLPAHAKLTRAEQILDEVDEVEKSENLETLGLAGAIWKRMWQANANKASLEKSLSYYRKGHRLRLESDDGYVGINAAYVLDQLAWIEEREAATTGVDSPTASCRRAEAQTIRQEVLGILSKLAERETERARREDREWTKPWWYLVTGGEACFGLGRFDDARDRWLNPARDLQKAGNVTPWEFETTAVQLASLARLLPEEVLGKGPPEETEAWAVLDAFLDQRTDAVRTVVAGKFGLGLSGGGFRASFYHIGVLARLAELDLLRHVHVLSCVSGGSIVGTHYFLELRKLLESKFDSSKDADASTDVISRDDYIKIVERVEDSFLKGVERNIRMRVAGNLFQNLRMAFSSTYSRTVRAGELYEKELYKRVMDGCGPDRYIHELKVLPKGAVEFNPKYENWLRRNKVPMLVLNATTLNTGHNWQFTASWMGESPFSIDAEIDGNWRYRRMYYDEAPERYRHKIRLGTAVGASACVPGLFEPVLFPDLYPKEGGNHPEMTVRLVDGGVHDNQGIASLLEQDCSVLFVSDASGQMTSDPKPKGGVLGPLLRTNSVLMERIRQAQFLDLEARKRSSLIRNLVVVHLKKGLVVEPISWKRCKEPADLPLSRKEELLEYGILRRIQRSLANIRTDLDSFSEVEAHSLMASGYLMCERYATGIKELPQTTDQKHDWKFLDVVDALRGEAPTEKQQDEFEKILRVGSNLTFKVWRLSRVLLVLAGLLGLIAVAGFIWAVISKPGYLLIDFEFTLRNLGLLVLWSVIGLIGGGVLVKFIKYEDTLKKFAKDMIAAFFAFCAVQVHLLFFDPLFLKIGRMKRFLPKRKS